MKKIHSAGYLPSPGDDLLYEEGGCLATIYTVEDAQETWEGCDVSLPVGITKHPEDGVYDIVVDKSEITVSDVKQQLKALSKITGEEYEFEYEE